MISDKTYRIFISAAEPSGDRLGEELIVELKSQISISDIYGMGGDRLMRQGVDIWSGFDALALTGLREAFGGIKAALNLEQRFIGALIKRKPDLCILIDSPGINLRLAGIAKKFGVPVLYYGAPQRWAWLQSRTKHLKKRIDALAVLLPFEQRFFRSYGINAHYVGHPLVRRLKPIAKMRQKQKAEGFALFPGSRISEIKRHMPRLVEVFYRISDFDPFFVAAGAPQLALIRHYIPKANIVSSKSALIRSEAALCASGTVSLELGLLKIPHAVFYDLLPPSSWIAKQLIKIPYVSLPNLILEKAIIEEFLLKEMRVECLVDIAERLMDKVVVAEQISAFEELKNRMMIESDSAAHVAEMARVLLKE